jgi:hypothetical protein
VVFLGIATYRRPAYLAQVLAGVEEHLREVVSKPLVVHDGPDPDPPGDGWWWHTATKERRGPAATKNVLLEAGMASGAEWIAILEDDVVPLSEKAVTGYVAAAEASGWGHLAYAHHGPANASGPRSVDGLVSYYPNYVGAWSIYSRQAIETCGLFDENFDGCWEHVEHTLRLSLAGFHPMPEHHMGVAADATGSENWLAEIPGSIEASHLRNRPDWPGYIRDGKRYWAQAHPETYCLLFR